MSNLSTSHYHPRNFKAVIIEHKRDIDCTKRADLCVALIEYPLVTSLMVSSIAILLPIICDSFEFWDPSSRPYVVYVVFLVRCFRNLSVHSNQTVAQAAAAGTTGRPSTAKTGSQGQPHIARWPPRR